MVRAESLAWSNLQGRNSIDHHRRLPSTPTENFESETFTLCSCMFEIFHAVLPGAKARVGSQDVGLELGCQPPRKLSFRWPLGIDIIVEAFNADKQGHILDFFLKIVSRTGNTFEQRILGARGIDTQDPENIEAILSTQFNGMSSHLSHLESHSFLRIRSWSARAEFSSITGTWNFHPERSIMASVQGSASAPIHAHQVRVFSGGQNDN